MTPERHQQIKAICNEALQIATAERPAFLAQACGDDLELRREIESLLAYESQADTFIEKPALDVLAKAMAQSQPLTGRHISHFQVLSLLGKGGMGEVYLGLDKRLGRKIAIKLLLPEFTSNKTLVERFDQEARAASALNHPNIITVYEIDEFEGLHFIATELVEGQTLRQMMSNQPLELTAAVDITRQIASALNAAHKAGIVHRDIKPENVMIRPDGLVKVLDFGLAKLTELRNADFGMRNKNAETLRQDDPNNPQSPIPNPQSTASGIVMGTPRYMSPEQARGENVDARSDIFSLGVVLYEMLAGKPPFEGVNMLDVVGAILHQEPAALPEIPSALQRVLTKALRKNPAERYQSAQELLSDLAAVTALPPVKAVAPSLNQPTTRTSLPRRAKVLALGTAILALLVITVWWLRRDPNPASQSIRSLAVVPLKSLTRVTDDEYLGLGIANEVITKVSQINGLRVRPTSAVRKYARQEMDALQVGREQQVDAVLDGVMQREGEQLRVSINLLRVSDGTSLWADKFDLQFTEIFRLQDEVARQVAAHLRFELSAAEQGKLAKRYTSNPAALNYYMKGSYYFADRSNAFALRAQADSAVDFFQKAIAIDPNFALAHAQLGYAYAHIAIFHEDNPALIERAKRELDLAEKIDPQLAEVYVARHFILWSQYENFQTEAAIRGLLRAQQINPHIGHLELGMLYAHLGLEKWQQEMRLAVEQEPASEVIQENFFRMYVINNMPTEALTTNLSLANRDLDAVFWHIEKRDVGDAMPLIEKLYQQSPRMAFAHSSRAVFLALQGRQAEAEAEIPEILSYARVDPTYHHLTHAIARVYALGGKTDDALKWLRVTVEKGFPNYPLLQRDPYLNGIRSAPAFINFMTELRARYETYQRDFR